jgi:hypothetical protein
LFDLLLIRTSAIAIHTMLRSIIAPTVLTSKALPKATDAFRARRREGPYHLLQKRPPVLVSAVEGFAAVVASKNRLSPLVTQSHNIFASFLGVGAGREARTRIIWIDGHNEGRGPVCNEKRIRVSCCRARLPHRLDGLRADKISAEYHRTYRMQGAKSQFDPSGTPRVRDVGISACFRRFRL